MSRDDAPARPEAGPSIVRTSVGSFVSPRDLSAGGSWIAVNSFGVIACLLNRYDPAPSGLKTRGEIVFKAMETETSESAKERVRELELKNYAPFTCVILDRDGGARLDWTGSRLQVAELKKEPVLMMTSSSWNQEAVRRKRETLFRRYWSSDKSVDEKLSRFHCARNARQEAWSPMMLRDYAQTKSVTQIEVEAGEAAIRYWRRASAIWYGLSSPDTALSLTLEACTPQQLARAS